MVTGIVNTIAVATSANKRIVLLSACLLILTVFGNSANAGSPIEDYLDYKKDVMIDGLLTDYLDYIPWPILLCIVIFVIILYNVDDCYY